MATEVFLLHARNLLDFLSPRSGPHPNDALAEHYAPAWDCPDQTRLAGQTIVEWRRRIDKLLSHITYERYAIIASIGEEERWPIEALHRELSGKFAEFLTTLLEPYRAWFEQYT